MKLLKPFLTLLFCAVTVSGFAQSYVSKVSRDSVAVLTARVEVLKSAAKLNELKLAEAEQEADIRKQELKIADLISIEKATAEESSRLSEAFKEGKETNVKKVEKMSRKAAGSSKDVKNAQEKLQKQLNKVEETRTEIQTEERKLANREPIIIFSNKRN
ncbi:MAG TPA: hypothetical protein VLZ28_07170 [Daejeonella sp.]|nr:hypothetical protein [Daejeonella sp.]